MSNIRFEMTIDAPVNKVYRALTEAEGIQGWWTKDTDIAPKTGSEARFGFGPHGSMVFEITDLQENAHVAWKSVSAPPPDWKDTTVTFDLEAQDGGTKVSFGHHGFKTEEGSFASVSWQWAYFIMSLKSYVETGTGTPAGA